MAMTTATAPDTPAAITSFAVAAISPRADNDAIPTGIVSAHRIDTRSVVRGGVGTTTETTTQTITSTSRAIAKTARSESACQDANNHRAVHNPSPTRSLASPS